MANHLSRRSSCTFGSPLGIRKPPILGREDEIALVRRVRQAPPGDPCAHELVLSNLAFVFKIANEYKNMGLPIEDLVNEGALGVMEAARHFDPARGTRFLTYAVWWIRKGMLRAVARHGALVQVPIYQLKKLRSVANARRQLSKEFGREADREEIAREMQIALSKIDAILQVRSRELSLDDTLGPDSDTPLSDRLADERSVNPENEFLRHENEELVRWAVGTLDEEERSVIMSRFGLEGGRVSTLREIGVRLGVSRERIRQLEVRAKNRLRKAITGQRRLFPAPRDRRRVAAHTTTVPA
jgi:RNA polymerase primary sigma factor